MLAPRTLPSEYDEWNRSHHAPFGRRGATRIPLNYSRHWPLARYRGPYGWQPNNSLRRYEYPWAYDQIRRLGESLTIADIGAGVAGLQFTLAQCGYQVHAVDPGMAAAGKGWAVDAALHAHLCRVYHAPVTLHATTIDAAGLADASVDVVVSISTIEHFTEADVASLVQQVRRVLRPGGHIVFTIDLFLDLLPFADASRNHYGTNIDVAELLAALGAELVVGRRDQLYGFPQFSPRDVLGDLSHFMIGEGYPALASCLVARLP